MLTGLATAGAADCDASAVVEVVVDCVRLPAFAVLVGTAALANVGVTAMIVVAVGVGGRMRTRVDDGVTRVDDFFFFALGLRVDVDTNVVVASTVDWVLADATFPRSSVRTTWALHTCTTVVVVAVGTVVSWAEVGSADTPSNQMPAISIEKPRKNRFASSRFERRSAFTFMEKLGTIQRPTFWSTRGRRRKLSATECSAT